MSGDGAPRGPSRSDSEAFERWFHTHHDRLLRQCVRLLRDRAAAEDVAQETLLRAWLGRERMREEDLGAWLSVVARNLCISHMRRTKKQIPTESLPDTPDEAADPAVLVERGEVRRMVRRAMRQVGERHSVLLFRREVEGLEYAELGAELGLTPGGARSVLFRARRVLRDRLAAVGEGMGAWLAGARLRVRLAVIRGRNAARGLDSMVSSMAPATLNMAMAFGVTLATLGGGTAFAAAAAHQLAPRPRVLALHGAPAGSAPRSGDPGRVTGDAPGVSPRASKPLLGGPVGSRSPVRGHAYDDKSKTTDVIIGTKRYNVEIQNWRGPDGFWLLYLTEDKICAASPEVCAFLGRPIGG